MKHDPIKHERLIRRLLAMTREEVETDSGRALCAEALSFAPVEIQEEMTRYMIEIGIIPKVPASVDDQGNAYYSVEQLAASIGVPVEEVRQRAALMAIEHPELSAPAGARLHRVH